MVNATTWSISPGAQAPGLFLFVPMHPDLERLIALQRINSAAHDADRRLAEEPERHKLFEARLEESRLKVAATRERLTTCQSSRRAIEKDLAVHQGRLSKFRDQLMVVKTNVEYQAMQKEIEFAQHEVKQLEDRILELMLESDDLTAAVKAAEVDFAAEQKKVEADRRAFAEELATLKASLVGLANERAKVVSELDPHALTIFETVARRRNGVAVAEAREGVCTVCHVRLRPQVFNEIRRNAQIIQCDSCSRILYFVPAPSPSAEASGQSAP
jgi:predicted  nucleic acid-binding Zn-ribbon protein